MQDNNQLLKTAAVRRMIDLLSGFAEVPSAVATLLHQKATIATYAKGDFVLRKGERCEYYFFIYKGMLRGISENGSTPITTWINPENEIVSSIYSLFRDQPVLESIEVLEDSILLLLHVSDVEQIFDTSPDFNKVVRLVLQQYYRDAEIRAFMARIPDAEAKYRFFLQEYPILARQVQQQYIASFLGIRQETLSRIRKKLSQVSPHFG